MFTQTFKKVSKRARAVLPLAIVTGLFCYFAVHIIRGDHGLEVKDHLKHRVSELNQSLHKRTTERKALEQKILLLQDKKPSKDLIDELAKQTFSYAKPNELVIVE